MKYIVVLLFSLSLMTYSHSQNNNVNVTSGNSSPMVLANAAAKEQGMFVNGNGKYTVVKVGRTGFVSLRKLQRRALEQIRSFATSNNLNWKEINIQKHNAGIGVFPKVEVTYQLFNSDGSLYLSDSEKINKRSQVIKELKELKELYDMGILTENEYNTQSAKLKKLLNL
tara:strand:- start:71 stop:577 length:507 start_codon:yes stop_codon:yes gene_type:complete